MKPHLLMRTVSLPPLDGWLDFAAASARCTNIIDFVHNYIVCMRPSKDNDHQQPMSLMTHSRPSFLHLSPISLP